MDLKRVSSFENLIQPDRAGAVTSGGVTGAKDSVGQGSSFQETLNKIQSGFQPGLGGDIAQTAQVAKPNVAGVLGGVKFSNHAVERMQSRGISFNKDDMSKLNEAVSRAAGKGSQDTLVLMNDAALIVSVKNKTVVTVMDKAALKENVFTNIDSTIVM